MKKHIEILKKCPLFEGIYEENLIRMLGCLGARVEHFGKKYTIFSEGAPARLIGIMLNGTAQITQVDYYGNRSLLGNVQPSEIFGEAFACASVPSLPISVIANEDADVMLIDCSHILHVCENACGFHHKLIYNLMKDLAEKTIMLHQRSEITSRRTTREKLIAYLMMMAKKTGKSSFDIPFDRQELADYLEVDRSGLSSEISKLRAEGVIESYKNSFKLL
ncbi:MAG: Crp/Fnr family transcriptional regulator [Clostridia bacterium]|nr:Crp/Fnr family transcriptional regulator [Clostridia bacterium]